MSETLQETMRNKASASVAESAYYSTQRIYIAVSVIRNQRDSTDEDNIDIHHLQVLYRSHIAERGKLVHPHITRFTDLLKNSNIRDSVIQEVMDGKHKIFRTAKIDSIIYDTDWLQLLRKAGKIRTCQNTSTCYMRNLYATFFWK